MKDQADKELYNAAQAGDLKAVEAALAKGADIEKGNSSYTPLSAACYYNKTEVAKYLLSKGAKVNADCSQSPLYGAAYKGNKELVELLVGKGADIEKGDSSYTPLSIACNNGKVEVAKYLLSKGAKVNADCINSPLYYAACKGDKELVELLVGKGADIEKGNSSYTPLSIACYYNKTEVAKFLLSKGAKVNTDCSQSPLYGAAYKGNKELVELLVGKGADIEKGNSSNTPLSAACYYNKTEVAKYLLSKGAKVNAGCSQSPLYGAAYKGNKELVELLVGKGADIEKVSNNYTPLSVACCYNKTEVAKYLLSKGAKVNVDCSYTPLYGAASNGTMELVELLIGKGAEVDKAGEYGETALMRASANGKVGVVEKLLAAGAEVDRANENGKTALMRASANGKVGVVEKLLAAGAEVDRANENGRTALMEAIQGDREGVVEKLLAAGAEVDKAREDGWTALMEASLYGKLYGKEGIVEKLLAAGAKVDKVDNYGSTALMVASQGAQAVVVEGQVGIVEKLLAAGAEVDRANKNGKTALMWASHEGQVEVVEKLLAAGAEVDRANKNGKTALMKASENGEVGAVEKLLAAGAEVDKAAENGKTALMEASKRCRKGVVEKLLAAGADITKKDDKGRTALDYAQSRRDIAKLLEEPNIYLKLGAKSKEINKIASQIKELDKSSDLGKTMELIKMGSDRISSDQPEAIILLGKTGAGKSSLTYYLSDKELKAVVDDDVGELLVEAVKPESSIVIGHRAKSETKVPNKSIVRLNNGGDIVSSREIVIWDSPGFMDTSISQEVANGFYIKKLYSQHKQLKFVLVVPDSAIYESRGTEFVGVLEQFCQSFGKGTEQLEAVKDNVYMVVTKAGSHRSVKHIVNKLEGILADNPSLSGLAKQMLGYLIGKDAGADSSSVIDRASKIGLFHKPAKEGELVGGKELLKQLDGATEYFYTKHRANKAIGQISLTEKAKELSKLLMQQTGLQLEKLMLLLEAASKEPLVNVRVREDNIFNSSFGMTVKGLLPAELVDVRQAELPKHTSSEHWLGVKQLLGLRGGFSLLQKQLDNIGAGAEHNLEKLIVIIKQARALLSVYEEYALTDRIWGVGKAREELAEQIYKYSYALKHQLSCCQILGEIAGTAAEVELKSYYDCMLRIKKNIEAAYQDRMDNIKLEAGNGDADYYKQILSYLLKYQAELGKAKAKTTEASILVEKSDEGVGIKVMAGVDGAVSKCSSNISKGYAELGKLSISKGVGNYQQAIKYYAKSLEYVQDYTVYDQLGDLLASLGQWQLASKCYVVSENHWQLRECSKQLVAKIQAKQVDQATASKLCAEIADNWSAVGDFTKAARYYKYAKSKAVDKAMITELNSQIISCLDDTKIAKWKKDYIARKSKTKLVEQYDYTLLPMRQLKVQLEAKQEYIEAAEAKERVSGGSISGKTELLPGDEHLAASIIELVPYEIELGSESLLGQLNEC